MDFEIGEKINTPNPSIFDARIIEIKGKLAVIKGNMEFKNRSEKIVEVKRTFPLNALRKETYSETDFSEENRFGSLITWEGTEIEKSTPSISVLDLYERYAENKIETNPQYQRDLVWTLEQKQEYITALLKSRAEIKPVFTLEYENGNDGIYEVVDGKQRLNAVFDFIEDKFSVPSDKKKRKEMKFSELSAKDVLKILNFNVEQTVFICFDGKIPLSFKIELFLEINEKGTRMSAEHIKKVKQIINQKCE